MDDSAVPTVAVAEVRDYDRINAEVRRLLDEGHRRVRLSGVGGQRLLLLGLSGPWEARIELDGNAGPELAAEMDAPGLTVVCRGSAADGLASGLQAGWVAVLGEAGDAAGIGQAGGVVAVRGPAGHRAGLNQSGGVLALLGGAGRLAGDRQSGGTIFVQTHRLGPGSSRGHRGGRLVTFQGPPTGDADLAGAIARLLPEFGIESAGRT